MNERRAKGFCFKCGGKFHPTLHNCLERPLRLLILGDDESLNDDGEIVTIGAEEELDDEEVEAECKLIGVLGSMEGCRTMKIESGLEDVGIVVALIDNETSHNFISQRLTSAVGQVTPMVAKGIKLGDGHKVFLVEVYQRIGINLGFHVFVLDAMVLEFGGLDVVMGLSWLSTLGKGIMKKSPVF